MVMEQLYVLIAVVFTRIYTWDKLYRTVHVCVSVHIHTQMDVS